MSGVHDPDIRSALAGKLDPRIHEPGIQYPRAVSGVAGLRLMHSLDVGNVCWGQIAGSTLRSQYIRETIMDDEALLRAAKRSGLLDYFTDSGLDAVMCGELGVLRRFIDLVNAPPPRVAEASKAVEKKPAPPARVARTWVDV